MPLITAFDRLRLDWIELRPSTGGTFELRLAARQGHANGHEPPREYAGWEGTTAAQRQALRTAVLAILRARIAFILETNPATHDLAVEGGEFIEQTKA